MARTELTSNTTFYVSPTGSDSTGNGSSGNPWQTGQFGYEYLSNNYDPRQYSAILQYMDGTYSCGSSASIATFSKPYGGPVKTLSWIQVQGNNAAPANVLIQTTSAPCFSTTFGSLLILGGFKLESSSNHAIYVSGGGQLDLFGNMEYGTCGQSHKVANVNGLIVDNSQITISGSAQFHNIAEKWSTIEINTTQTTFSAAVNIGVYNCVVDGYVFENNNSYVNAGNMTGKKFEGHYHGSLDTGGHGSGYWPGSSAGTLADTSVLT